MGKPRNTRKYLTYPVIPEIPENTRSYFSTLLLDLNPTRYPVFCPIPDPTRPDIEKPYPLGTGSDLGPIIKPMLSFCSSLFTSQNCAKKTWIWQKENIALKYAINEAFSERFSISTICIFFALLRPSYTISEEAPLSLDLPQNSVEL